MQAFKHDLRGLRKMTNGAASGARATPVSRVDRPAPRVDDQADLADTARLCWIRMNSNPNQPTLIPPSRKSLPPFEALRAFDAVARLGGVRKAAQSLCRDHAAVSRHLRAIEAWTGATLIERTSSGVVLTEDGVRYHKQIASALDMIAHATIDLMRRGNSHRLQIRCMPAFALHWLSGRLGDFEKNKQGLDIELRPTDRSPDFSSYETDVDIRCRASKWQRYPSLPWRVARI